jgi:hypothetical protein
MAVHTVHAVTRRRAGTLSASTPPATRNAERVTHSSGLRRHLVLIVDASTFSRTLPLQGMFYEAQGNPEKAEGFYHEIIKEQPSNQTISKRLVGARTHGPGRARGAGGAGSCGGSLTQTMETPAFNGARHGGRSNRCNKRSSRNGPLGCKFCLRGSRESLSLICPLWLPYTCPTLRAARVCAPRAARRAPRWRAAAPRGTCLARWSTCAPTLTTG